LQKKLNIDEPKYRFAFHNHEVTLSSQVDNEKIKDSEWLVLNARGFNSEIEAREFAGKLKAATEISSIAARLGIDTGVDARTAGLGQYVKDHIRKQSGLDVRDNVHGIDVFFDDPNVRIFLPNFSVTVLGAPDPFLGDLNKYYDSAVNLSQNAKGVILLLNYALMRPEPVAQIIFATSAVEMLGQQEDWNTDQKLLLEKLAALAESETVGTIEGRAEVASAIRRNIHKIGLRQGVMRLLDGLGLTHLKREWDTLYGERSTLVHGLAPKPGADYGDLAFKTISLCGRILLTVIAKEIESVKDHVDTFY
jgi:hypothetical protein